MSCAENSGHIAEDSNLVVYILFQKNKAPPLIDEALSP